MSASTKARQLYPEAFCQPMRPYSAMALRCRSRGVGAVSAVWLGTALERGGTITAASGWRSATASGRLRGRSAHFISVGYWTGRKPALAGAPALVLTCYDGAPDRGLGSLRPKVPGGRAPRGSS